MSDGDRVIVCADCLRRSCFAGAFVCTGYMAAATKTMTVKELRALDLEHPSWWEGRA